MKRTGPYRTMSTGSLKALLQTNRQKQKTSRSKLIKHKKKRKAAPKEKCPFVLDETVLEHIGYAAGGFQIFLELTPLAQDARQEQFLLSRFVLACIAWSGSENGARQNIENGYGYITDALQSCCGKKEKQNHET